MSFNGTWYTGSEIKPEVTIDGLTEGKDYTVKYENNISVGTATVVVTAVQESGWVGSVSKKFKIMDADLVNLSHNSYTYDGNAKEPKLTLLTVDKTTELKEGTDYDVAYSDNVNAGTATATITLKGNYDGVLEKNFNIDPQDISGRTASLSREMYSCEYGETSFEAKEPTVTIEGLVKDTDYTVDYSDNTKPGTATVEIKGIGNYCGTITKEFRIGYALEGTVKLSQSSFVYDGTEKKPKATLGDYIEGKDFEVSYSNNKKAGTAKVTVDGIGVYVGTKSASFTIESADLNNAEISIQGEHFVFYDSSVEPSVNVKLGDLTLSSKDDYTVSYSDNKAAGKGTVTITGKNNYKGTNSKTFDIHLLTKHNAVASTCTTKGNTEYYECSCGKYYEDSTATKEIKKDSWVCDYAEHKYDNIVIKKASTQESGYTAHKKCTVCKEEVGKVMIPQIDVNSIELDGEYDYIYGGEDKEPTVVVKDLAAEPYTLIAGTDYDVSYSNNTAVGTAKASIQFKGKYEGTVEKGFGIIDKNMSNIEQDISFEDCNYDGEEKTATNLVIKDGTKTLKENTDYVLNYENNVNPGQAKLTITFQGNYSGSIVRYFEIVCEHNHLKGTAEKPATCTTAGNTAYWFCSDCGSYFSDGDCKTKIAKDSWIVKAKGHNYVNHTTPAGYMSNGRSYDECTNCHSIINDTTLPGYSTSYVKSFKVAKGKKCFTAKWKKQNKKTQKLFSGYQVRWSTDPSMGGAGYKNVGKGKASVKIKGGAKTRYYVQVRTYTGGYYSPWSAMKSVVTK